MRRSTAAAGTSRFLAVAPGVVAGVIPWTLTRWELRPEPTWLRVLGTTLVVGATIVILQAFIAFVVEGLGTPAPIAPTEHLVVGGLYRYVRNPMYVAVVAAIAGQALVLGQPVLLVYAVLVLGVVAVFVRRYEEPHLSARHGAAYDDYRNAVPAWWPRPRRRQRPRSAGRPVTQRPPT